ncbi:MAG: glycosyltransferase [Acidobacteriota bacterium]|nr:glycosyltransferase [Acidobacteriota bacterium]
MDVIYYWSGSSFTPLEYWSALSTSARTGFRRILVFYDEEDKPDNAWWRALDTIPRLEKRPANEILAGYFQRYAHRSVDSIDDRRIRADLFRYAWLYEHGGAWLDFDTLQVRDIAAPAQKRPMTIAWEFPGSINIAVMAFTARHPVPADILKAVADKLNTTEHHFDVIGPPLMTRTIEALGLSDQVLPSETFYPVHPTLGDEVIFGNWPLSPDTYSIHVWAKLNRRHFENKTPEDFASIRSTYFDQVRELPSCAMDL